MNRSVQNILLAVVFVFSIVIIFICQKNIGYMGLLIEIIGLVGLIGVLFMYNRRYK